MVRKEGDRRSGGENLPAIELIELIGHSTNSELLDSYLKRLGIKKRPRAVEALVFIQSKELSISLTFQDYLCYIDDNLTPPINEGPFVLLDVTFHAGGLWQLPYGLEFSASGCFTERKMGKPMKEVVKSAGKAVHFYVKGNLRVDIFYEHDAVVEVRFSSLDKYDKIHGFI